MSEPVLFCQDFCEGELAIFSLEGMENFIPGSVEFIQEAARRALTSSELGHIVFSDIQEGARWQGELLEQNHNDGEYLGEKIFQLKPGTTFALMLIPNSTVWEIFHNPNLEGDKRPLFSLADANPNKMIQMGQLIEETFDGGVFGFEDLPQPESSDFDFNDLIFQIKGGFSEVNQLFALTAENKNWSETALGEELITYAEETGIYSPFS